jgi:class I fructose-bisphosphate aldolase
MKDMDDSAITRNGNSLIVAYDHGLEHGPVDFEPQPESADPRHVFEVAKHDAVTAVAVQKGLAEKYYPEYEDDVNLIVKLNGTSNLWEPADYFSPLNCTVEYAVEELGADAVGYTMYAGSDFEGDMFEEFRRVQEQARKYDVPVVMWAYPRGNGIEGKQEYGGDTDPDVISYAARIGLEIGADMVKCKYPGSQEGWEQLEQVSGEMKSVMSGGSKTSDRDFLEDVHSVISAGGNGLAVGRNIFQRDNPQELLDKLEKVIFEEKSVDEVV